MKRVFVTGGSGFIGSHFVRLALKNPTVELLNLDLLTYAAHPHTLDDLAQLPQYQFVQGDISDASLIAKLLADFEPDVVVNFAAESHVDRSIDGPAAFIQTNIVGTFTLLEQTLGYWEQLAREKQRLFRFLHVSTDEVYGALGAEGLFTEQSRYAPSSPYSASKASSDHLVQAWHKTYGLPTLIVHGSNNYGPYQHPEKLIPHTIFCALAGKPINLYGNGQNVRDWLYVEDFCRAIKAVIDKGKPGEAYNVGADNEKTNLEIVDHLCDRLDEVSPASSGHSYRSLKTFVEDRPGHDWRYAIDACRIRNNLGWHPLKSFRSSLDVTVDWYLNNSQWCAHYSDIHIRLGTRHP